MALDLCERWRAEQERCRRVHAAQRLSRDPGPSHSRSRSRSPNSCRSSVSGSLGRRGAPRRHHAPCSSAGNGAPAPLVLSLIHI